MKKKTLEIKIRSNNNFFFEGDLKDQEYNLTYIKLLNFK